MKRKYRDEIVKFTFLIPALLFFTLVILVPFVRGINIAFTNWDGIAEHYKYVGLRNIILFFQDNEVIGPLKNTLFFAFITTFFVNVFGLILAVALNNKFKGVNFLKAVIFMPMVISLVLAAVIWRYVFSDIYPLIFNTSGGLLGNPNTVMWGIAIICIWKETGLAMVIYFAGLQTIPKDMYECARIDGANPVQQFFKITMPLLMPAFTYCIPLWLGTGLRQFDYSMVATKGGPGRASETMAMYIYNYEFPYFKAGYGQMSALILFAMILVITLIITQYLRRKEVEF
ncbi:carbohydrate ABC transporter permease [Paenibacillus sp. V4I5]|uniref:carbohydrate ABC transporter permease n=1 Tax=Paenibacillus sp. V4I5 TaxID=3042306 RepID=UPI0027918080|nr:sugar ABC transporter permease [Paenibacillus sp. V4I5]MDQ0917031.1 raffinose/stachyose/melibiose transport system permease protein [Paenibacillus sp. V4I5]